MLDLDLLRSRSAALMQCLCKEPDQEPPSRLMMWARRMSEGLDEGKRDAGFLASLFKIWDPSFLGECGNCFFPVGGCAPPGSNFSICK